MASAPRCDDGPPRIPHGKGELSFSSALRSEEEEESR